MKAYLQKFPGYVQILLILEECGVRFYDLPSAGIVDRETGKQCLCWSYVLGNCTYTTCRFAAKGGHPETVTDEFVDAVCTVLGPCIKKIMDGGQSPAKKVKPEDRGQN